MKRILAFALAFTLVLSIVSCGSNQVGPVQTGSVFTIKNGAYTRTSDEFVLALRKMIDRVESVDFTPRVIPLPSEKDPDAIKY